MGIEPAGILGGLATFVFLLCIVAGALYLAKIIKPRTRTAHFWRAMHLGTATIAHDMMPLLRQLDLRGAKITIVGGDGAYASSRCKAVLLDGLCDLIERGAQITYILTAPNEVAVQALRKAMKDHDKVFKLFEVPVSPEDKDGLGRYRNFHPTLVEMVGSNAMWVEGEHPDDSTEAYEVVYVSSNAMTPERESEFQSYKNDINALLERARTQDLDVKEQGQDDSPEKDQGQGSILEKDQPQDNGMESDDQREEHSAKSNNAEAA